MTDFSQNDKESEYFTNFSKNDNKENEADKALKLPNFLRRVGVVDKMLFSRHLRVMLKAGLPFSRALTVLTEQTNNQYFKEVLHAVRKDIQNGKSLADSLSKHPKVFNDLFVNMIKVGETSGNLEEVLDVLYIQLKKEHELTSRVSGALIYPLVIIFAMAVIGALMMIFVVPSLLKIFQETNTKLPMSTQIIIFISNAFVDYGIFIFIGIIVFFIVFFQLLKNKEFKKAFDKIMLSVPVIGGIISKVNMARFSRTLSSMIVSGVSIVKSLQIISKTLGNTYYKNSIKYASERVQKGIPLSEVIGEYKSLYKPLMIHMIEVGEETGTLEDTLKQVAEFYEDEVEQITSNLSSIIEPVLMLIIGSAVGFFAISMIQPMYSIMGSI